MLLRLSGLLGVLLLALFPQTQASETSCRSTLLDETVLVTEIISGNLLRLQDGRKLNLPNLHIPKIEFKNDLQQSQISASARLKQKLKLPATILIRKDKRDFNSRHQLVAHAFLPDETNLQAWLLRNGLAVLNTQPEFPWAIKCYVEQENFARQNKLGVWQTDGLTAYGITDTSPLKSGYKRISGKVTRIANNGDTIWLHLTETMAVRIEQSDRKYFAPLKLESLRSHEIMVSGIIYPYKSGFNMRIRHPSMLKVVN